MNDAIPFNDLSRRPEELARRLDEAISRVVSSGWYVMGPEHAAFEQEFADYLGIGYALGVANGTDALELALVSLGVSAGDRVVTVANAGGYASIATRLIGAEPVYADVDPGSLQMTAETFEAALRDLDRPPAAVVVTHLFGAMAPIAEIAAVARRFGVAVVEDCAQAIGARNGAAAGTFGDVATASFYPTKNLGALGDGGAVLTDDPDRAETIRSLRQYGWESKYHITRPRGRNSRLDELQAAVLRVLLPGLDGRNERRRQIHRRFEEVSSSSARVVNHASESYIGHLATVVASDRDRVREVLRQQGVATDVHYPVPDHLQTVRGIGERVWSLPETERAAGEIFSLPLFPELTDSEVARISDSLERAGSLT